MCSFALVFFELECFVGVVVAEPVTLETEGTLRKGPFPPATDQTDWGTSKGSDHSFNCSIKADTGPFGGSSCFLMQDQRADTWSSRAPLSNSAILSLRNLKQAEWGA